MSSPRPHGPATSATTTALNQSVLLGGNSAGQGQMYLRVSLKCTHMLPITRFMCSMFSSYLTGELSLTLTHNFLPAAVNYGPIFLKT